jgi:hypothetical protein
MNNDNTRAVPVWFWIVGIIVLLWNLMGLMAFVIQMMMTDEAMAALPDAQQEIYRNIPMWVNIAFGLAVICGTIGSVLLLMRSKFAVPVLALSLLGVFLQYGYMFFLSNTASVMGAGAMVLPALVVLISIGLIPYSTFCKGKGFLR